MKYLKNYENYKDPFEKITTLIDDNEYNKIFNLCCNDVDLKKDTPIYRATGLSDKYYLIDPRKMDRKSAYTRNYYTLMIDNSEKWKEYPKRKNSVICALNDSYFGNEYRVVPLTKYNDILKEYNIDLFEQSKWGICPEDDIWKSFDDKISKILGDGYSLDDINNLISMIYHKAKNEWLNENNFNIFKQQLESLNDSDIKNIIENTSGYYESKFNQIYEFIKKSNLNLFEMLNLILDPQKNKFSIESYDEIKKHHYDTNEVWTDTPVLYIKNWY